MISLVSSKFLAMRNITLYSVLKNKVNAFKYFNNRKKNVKIAPIPRIPITLIISLIIDRLLCTAQLTTTTQ